MKIAIIKVTNTVIPNEWNVAKYEKNKTKQKNNVDHCSKVWGW